MGERSYWQLIRPFHRKQNREAAGAGTGAWGDLCATKLSFSSYRRGLCTESHRAAEGVLNFPHWSPGMKEISLSIGVYKRFPAQARSHPCSVS